jgi:dTDP-4-dehydrorhamnose 3,5-epimerase-like enzyme
LESVDSGKELNGHKRLLLRRNTSDFEHLHQCETSMTFKMLTKSGHQTEKLTTVLFFVDSDQFGTYSALVAEDKPVAVAIPRVVAHGFDYR